MCAVYASVMCELSCEMCMDMGSQGRFKSYLPKGQKKKKKDEDIGWIQNVDLKKDSYSINIFISCCII